MFDLHERVATPLTTDILERIGTLYGIEAEVRGRPPDVRLAARQNRTRPLVDALREILDAALRRLSPKSDMAKAIAYGTKRRLALCRFLDDGRLEIANNIAERALRGVAVGRRNWLFAGSKRAASVPQRSTPSCRPARPMASTRRPTSPTSLGRSQLIGQQRDGTSSCSGTGPRKPQSRWRKPRNFAVCQPRLLRNRTRRSKSCPPSTR